MKSNSTPPSEMAILPSTICSIIPVSFFVYEPCNLCTAVHLHRSDNSGPSFLGTAFIIINFFPVSNRNPPLFYFFEPSVPVVPTVRTVSSSSVGEWLTVRACCCLVPSTSCLLSERSHPLCRVWRWGVILVPLRATFSKGWYKESGLHCQGKSVFSKCVASWRLEKQLALPMGSWMGR